MPLLLLLLLHETVPHSTDLQFTRASTCVSVWSTAPCLFPLRLTEDTNKDRQQDCIMNCSVTVEIRLGRIAF